MFVQLRKVTVTAGNSDKVINRFSQPGIIEEQDGFIDLSVMVKKEKNSEEEEVIILVTWASEDHWKNWEKSDAHISMHKAKTKQPKPAHILNMEVSKYEVKAVKNPVVKK